MVSLLPITDVNREAVEALAVTPDQKRFVSGVRESILEAAKEPDARALYWAIYDEETPVGVRDDRGRGRQPRLHRPLSLEVADRRALPTTRLR